MDFCQQLLLVSVFIQVVDNDQSFDNWSIETVTTNIKFDDIVMDKTITRLL